MKDLIYVTTMKTDKSNTISTQLSKSQCGFLRGFNRGMIIPISSVNKHLKHTNLVKMSEHTITFCQTNTDYLRGNCSNRTPLLMTIKQEWLHFYICLVT